jgi:phosphate uptake regulator
MYVRRVQLSGGSTLIVSLPKEWVERVKLKKLDEVFLIPQHDNTLVIVPKKQQMEEGIVQVRDGETAAQVFREYVSWYLAGYELIKFQLQNAKPSIIQEVKEMIRRYLIGVEIVEESSVEVSTQVLPTHTNMPLKKALERMGSLTSSMQKEAVMVLEDEDVELARSIVERDDEVDRFYHFIVRQLNIALSNHAILNMIEPPTKQSCLGYMLAAKSIERSADHAVLIAKSLLMSEKGSVRFPKKIIEFGVNANMIFENSLKSMLSLDSELANQVLDSVSKALSEFDQNYLYSAKNLNMNLVSRTTLESLKRIIEYSADISEIVVNLSVQKGKTRSDSL